MPEETKQEIPLQTGEINDMLNGVQNQTGKHPEVSLVCLRLQA